MKFSLTALVQVLTGRRNNNTTTLTDDCVNKLTYRELQRECVSRGLRATGSAFEMRKRLLVFDHSGVVTSEPATSEPIADTTTTNMTDDCVDKLTYRELQRECKSRGLRATGSAFEMRKRLLVFDPSGVVTSEPATSEPIADTTTTNMTEAEVNALTIGNDKRDFIIDANKVNISVSISPSPMLLMIR